MLKKKYTPLVKKKDTQKNTPLVKKKYTALVSESMLKKKYAPLVKKLLTPGA